MKDIHTNTQIDNVLNEPQLRAILRLKLATNCKQKYNFEIKQ